MRNEYCEYLVDILSHWGLVTYRPMFSGYGLYKNGQIFALVCDDKIYLKVDKYSRSVFEEKECEQFTYTSKNKIAKMSYWSAPDSFFDEPDLTAYWAEMAYQAGLRAPSASKRKGNAGLC